MPDHDTSADNARAAVIQGKLMEISRQGILTGNFDLFLSCFHLPHRISTFEGSLELNGPEDVRRIFDGVREQQKALKVDRYVRDRLHAKFTATTRIVGVHESSMFSGGVLVAQPLVAMSIIDLRDGRWRVSSGQYATDGTHVLSRVTGAGRTRM